ncbi:hypothetical protein SISNIDRAFT_406536 [Sistotremastrum niveocremeum HHB9708]|uniref:tRNA ligase n=1 Tax=Sistotremastrum niveocremeum HHB9708 TaxID=1314777 RepID=A0A164Z077_9AGAM|nr:hypothetical protein SISNIDRAFT_406536 [Sistotremastrum niveocremeum HHB9708]
MSDTDLIQKLHQISRKNPKLIRSSTYEAPADSSITIRSWKMNEFKYYDVPSPFPTLARGLFTSDGADERIIARGYDKFFNIGEVPWTTWDAIERHTKPPYTLTLKSNGCIIFIAALSQTQLLITSKHSLGPIKGVEESHAQVGERHLERHLASVGKTKEDLASVLWDNNWTAVAELCDDSFEEHVLPYAQNVTGLHLHGINHSSLAFQTLPSSSSTLSSATDPPTSTSSSATESITTVEGFAKEWGFIPTPSFTLATISDVRQFTDEVSRTGKWKDEAVEGFVVRTHVQHSTEKVGKRDNPPYDDGASFFFKVKFDEPYMMYRDWREITKNLLSTFSKAGEGALMAAAPSKARSKRPETRVYMDWVKKEIIRDVSEFEGYVKQRGIIRNRERFLEWLASDEGVKALAKERGERVPKADSSSTDTTAVGKEGQKKQQVKTIIVPIAIPGCGKTSIALALTHLFPTWTHTQSDAVKQKKNAAKVFEGNVAALLTKPDTKVVIADKNNHLAQHRDALRTVAKDYERRSGTKVRLVGLNWSLNPEETNLPLGTVHRICSDRITERGDNHLKLIPDEDGGKQHEEVVWMFIRGREEVQEGELDDVVEMDLEEGLDEGVSRAVKGLWDIMSGDENVGMGDAIPDGERMGEAVGFVRRYVVDKDEKGAKSKTKSESKSKPETKEQVEVTEGKKKKKAKEARYYGFNVELDLERSLKKHLSHPSIPPSLQTLFESLKSSGRITFDPHITLVHSASLSSSASDHETAKPLWDTLESFTNSENGSALFRFTISHILFTPRLIALSISPTSLAPIQSTTTASSNKAHNDGAQESGVDPRAQGVLNEIPKEVKERMHITVGTRDSGVKPVEAGDVIASWKKGTFPSSGSNGKEGIIEIGEGGIEARGRIRGMR